MREKCVKIGLVLLGKEVFKRNVPKCIRNASKLRQKCVKSARNTFGGEHLLDDTDYYLELIRMRHYMESPRQTKPKKASS